MASTTSPALPHTDRWIAKPEARLPTMLNVLTILTFIDNAFGFAFSFIIFALAPLTYQAAVRNQGRFDQLPFFVQAILGSDHVERARMAMENRLPILLFFLLAVSFRFFGALQMRHLKKRGFYLYILGNLLPGIAVLALMKVDPVTGIAAVVSYTFALIFVILYATQLKYMK
jgi:hypothetical protein